MCPNYKLNYSEMHTGTWSHISEFLYFISRILLTLPPHINLLISVDLADLGTFQTVS